LPPSSKSVSCLRAEPRYDFRIAGCGLKQVSQIGVLASRIDRRGGAGCGDAKNFVQDVLQWLAWLFGNLLARQLFDEGLGSMYRSLVMGVAGLELEAVLFRGCVASCVYPDDILS
jgi:hypothetical protein